MHRRSKLIVTYM